MLPDMAITPAPFQRMRSFAFFIHPTNDPDSLFGLRMAFPDLDEGKLERVLAWARLFTEHRLDAEPVAYMEEIISHTGARVHGWLVFSTFTAREMMLLSKKSKARLLDNYVAAAKRLKVDYIGLGAFTSILSRAGEYFRHCGIPVTTGNSYTAMCSIKAVETLLVSHGRSAQQQSVAVIGAYGSIGRTVSLHAAHVHRKLTLIGNAANDKSTIHLEALAGDVIAECFRVTPGAGAAVARHVVELLGREGVRSYANYLAQCRRARQAPLLVIGQVVPGEVLDADIVYCATSNGGAFLSLSVLAKARIVCDIARPSDLDRDLLNDSGITYVEGGLSYLPHPISFGNENLQGFPPEINLGCLSETIALTMDAQERNFSLGSAVSLDEARTVYEICLKHGFRPCASSSGAVAAAHSEAA
jgi:predicted amino acid dehydrogenase